MTRTRSFALLSLASLLSLGCSSSPAPIPAEDIPDELADAFCAQFVECATARGMGGELSYLMLSPTFSELCPSLFARQLSGLDYLADAVDTGRVLYDGNAARRCLDEIVDSCTLQLGFTLFPSCREVYRGTVPAGASCTLSEECEPGSRCDAQLVGDACDGECVALLPPGTPCGDDEECLAPEGSPGTGRCDDNGGIQDVCITQGLEVGATEGEACGMTDDTGIDRLYVACAAEFFCDDPDDDGEGTCRAPLAEGELCEGGRACEVGSVCVSRDMNARCLALTIATNVGDACDDVDIFCDYAARLECDGGTCVALAPGACEDDIHCSLSEYCDDATSTCEALKAVGAECTSSNECETRDCRDDGTMTGTERCVERVRCG